MTRNPFRQMLRRLGPRPVDARVLQAARGSILSLDELAERPRDESERVIRSLCSCAYLGGSTALCRVLGRYKMLVDTEDMGVSVHLIGDGFWEMWLTAAMLRLVKPGMTAVDLGANLGYFSLLMSDLVGAGGRVHAFEPNAGLAGRLRKSLAINGFGERATVHEQAIGDRSGSARLFVPANEPGGGHVLHDEATLPGADIRIDRFDVLPALAGADFVKIDVEGAEHAVWRGMAGFLATGRPVTIVLEFTAARYPDPGAFVDEVLAAGFALSVIRHDGGIAPIDRATLLASPMKEQLVLLQR